MNPARIAGLVVAAAVVAVLGVNFVLAVKPAVDREKQSLVDEACVPLEPDSWNKKFGSMKEPLPAPDIQALDVTGKMVPLSAYRGKVVLLNFWASWCAPCVEEMPSMDALQVAFGKDLVVLAISADKSWADIRNFFTNGTNMTVLWDPAAGRSQDTNTGVLAGSYGTDKLPESFLIDREGNIRYYIVNTRNWTSPAAQRCIRRLVAE